jgi:hypothetical protein
MDGRLGADGTFRQTADENGGQVDFGRYDVVDEPIRFLAAVAGGRLLFYPG